MTSPAAARGREVRQRLLNAAAELIPERGWTAVSTRILAERAGVTPSVVHYHFPSLRALLTEAVLGVMRDTVGELQPVLDAARTPGDALDALLASVDQYTGVDPMSLLFTEAYLAATRDEQLREAMTEVLIGFRQHLGRWFGERGVPAPDETAAVVMAAVDGLVLHRALTPGQVPGPAAAVLRRLVD
ncbi:MAG: TetR/AcrR family transcriptional regulator [Pseudonocardiaceae bacterium]